jgi:hypothetical protein
VKKHRVAHAHICVILITMTDQPNPEDFTDDELLAMLSPRQLADLDRAIAELMGPEGLDKVIPLQVTAQLYTVKAAERDPTSALAMLQMAAAMRRRAELLAAESKPKLLD